MNVPPFRFKSSCRVATILFSIIALFGSARAETFTVTKVSDTNDGVCNADCSLREAIAAANNLPSDDIIEFSTATFSSARRITLTGDSLNISNNGSLEIRGSGAALLSISGGNSYRIFFINQSATVALRFMTIRDGNGYGQNLLRSGGAILNSEGTNTTLENVIVSNSRLASSDTGINLVGGGILNLGTMTILRSRIENNQVSAPPPPTMTIGGGGIYNGVQATLNLIESSVTNNTVEGNGGGIFNTNQARLNIINSTISGNSATGINGLGGGILNYAIVDVTHTTIANNTASVAHGGVSTFGENAAFNSRNSIYADNTVGSNGGDFSGPMISGGFNLIENTTDTVITGDATGNILNQDPMLRPLVRIAGVNSLFHMPNPYSPAVDNGKAFEVSTDQRSGNDRPFDNPRKPNAPGGDGTDIGAVELKFTETPNPAPFDFDGDRKTDISVFRPSTGAWWFIYSSSNVLYNKISGSATDKIVPADYTGDFKIDVTIFRPSTAIWYVSRSEYAGGLYSFQLGAIDDIPAPGDFDGDGKIDAAIYRPSTGQWFIQRSSDGVVVDQQFGIAEDKPAVADYDGDGKADIAIFRPSTGAWWIQRSSLGVIAIQFGTAEDKIVQGDYTGDGKADLALWRESNGFWYILRSEDYSYYGFPFGTSGDVPIPGDYDGDGKLDAGVYRPSNNGWYLLRSTAGILSLQFGNAGDYPIPNIYVR